MPWLKCSQCVNVLIPQLHRPFDPLTYMLQGSVKTRGLGGPNARFAPIDSAILLYKALDRYKCWKDLSAMNKRGLKLKVRSHDSHDG